MYRIIVSGGGTGGHIFPAIAIANTIKELYPDTEILFVGAEGRMEMERVPQAGYKIVGLPISGFDRKNLLKNIPVLFGLFKSMQRAKKVIRDFAPDAAVGVGGYASGPLLRIANKRAIPTLLLEPNSYAGVTNKLLAKGASVICVGGDGMERFFPAEKIVITGSPVRRNLFTSTVTLSEAQQHFGLNPNKKTILLIGGSLGARTLNNAIKTALPTLAAQEEVQLVWQCGKYYHEEMQAELAKHPNAPVVLLPFISEMDKAYKAADLIISRSGAGTISELYHIAKPTILVPSPNVAEDHQTVNALALVNKVAAVLVKDIDAETTLVQTAIELLNEEERCRLLSKNILKLAQHNSDKRIVEELIKIINNKK